MEHVQTTSHLADAVDQSEQSSVLSQQNAKLGRCEVVNTCSCGIILAQIMKTILAAFLNNKI